MLEMVDPTIITKEVFVLQSREDWDGRFIVEHCEFTDNPDYDKVYYSYSYAEVSEHTTMVAEDVAEYGN